LIRSAVFGALHKKNGMPGRRGAYRLGEGLTLYKLLSAHHP
jgi:hypothetical protein